MADQPTVETTPQDAPQEPQGSPPSAPVPATPATPDVDRLLAERLENERRKWQAGKDREIAQLRRQQQEREQMLVARVQGTLGQHDQEAAAALPQQFAQDAEVADALALKRSMDEQQTAWAEAAQNAAVYGLKAEDPRLYPAPTWDVFHENARKAMAEDVAKERERLKAQSATEAKKSADAQIASGQLATLGGAPAAPVAHEAELDGLYGKLAELQKLGASKAEREKVKARLRDLGETNI